MAEQTNARPPEGQLVDDQRLNQALMGNRLVDSGSYTGSRNPQAIWQRMSLGDGSAIPHYRELEDKDDDVSAALDELKLSVLERDWTISPGDDSQAALDARDFAMAQLNNLDFDSAMDALLDAAPYGFAVSELIYDASEGQAMLVSIDDCPQELFLFGPRYQPQVGELQLLNGVYDGTGQATPADKFAVFSYRGRARNRTGRPLLRNAFWPSWFKRQTLGLWLRSGEKASGTAITRYADGATESDKQLAVQAAEAIIDGSAAALPFNMPIEAELLKATQTSPDVYVKLFEKQQYAIARAIKGETLTSFGNEDGGGSKAQGETHAGTFDQRSVSLAKKCNAVVNRQILAPLHRWNFGPNVPAPVFAWDTAEEQDLTRDLALMQGAQGMGISIGAKWAAARLEIPAIDKDDTPLTPNATDQVPALPGAAFAEASGILAHQHGQLDSVLDQFRAQAVQLLGERVGEIVDAVRESR